MKIKVIPNAPLLVEGTVELTLADGTTIVKNKPHLCRCGGQKTSLIAMEHMLKLALKTNF